MVIELSEWDGTAWAGSDPEIRTMSLPDESPATLLRRMSGISGDRPWRHASVRDALGVPAIQRSVALIASETGAMSMQGFRNGALMPASPRLMARPNPYEMPHVFYGGTAGNMAKYGEFVWWIAARDGDGFAAALVNVPLNELRVNENPDNRLLPKYQWGDREGTRYSGANPTGDFVHVMYPLTEPMALRGEGPLQLCRAAASIAVEAQEWAANFYAEGGNPSLLIKHAGQLSPERRDPVTFEVVTDPAVTGYNEAEMLRLQWMGKAHNVPRVIDQAIEKVEYLNPNEQGAQMLASRDRGDGDAARMFGIPGPLLEFSQKGSSLTYQNRSELMRYFLDTCLSPLYLEPIEQAMSDLQPRTIVGRFNVKSILRADPLTRWQIYQIAVDVLGPELAAAYAQREEGFTPGDVEFAPVPFSPPAAVPSSLPRRISRPVTARELRCDGTVNKVRGGHRLDERCNALLSTTGEYVGRCRRCKKDYAAAA